MPNQAKIDIVSEVQGKLENSSGVYFADYKGLSVAKVTELRKNFKAEGVEYKVVKNNLTKIAAKNAGYEGLDSILVGQIGLAFSELDPTAPARVMKRFIKDDNSLSVVGIIFEGQVFDAAKYEELADLPSKEELLSKLVGGLSSPMSKLVGTLSGTMSGLVGALNSLKEQKN
ncbi:MAG: 50S ribosomal protein L10 [Candidatus Marinimicrobia bacterium]|mgnify:CR=1 FL=1|nr:50S ribosomal protein L10 [Candidatus Neomarinimicrobiota bacterium]|tara:strand:+ start:2209 stop:2724 length:516 start_codon:yes stop_codon:yes gene_type:complete